MSRLPGWVERVHSLLVSPYGVRFVGSTMRWIRQQSDRPHLVIEEELQMPIHDWSKVKPGTYHNFHQLWTSSITNQLNSGILPRGCFAMAEQIIGGPEPDVVALKLYDDPIETPDGQRSEEFGFGGNGIALAPPQLKPTTSMVMIAEEDRYVLKSNRIVVRHELGNVLAVIELVSPGNKNSSHAIHSIVEKLAQLLREGINLLVIDPFPPSVRDPRGIHSLIWNEITDQPFELPTDRPLTIVSYQASPCKTAWVEPIAVGSPLPIMPLFLRNAFFINVPLETSYQQTWDVLPIELKRTIATPCSGG